ncbi:hypothetical protein C8R43DRAFT_902923, partial [Mycena crocata]
LDQSIIATNFVDDGQNPPVVGQSASSTTTNNYINFCSLTLPGTPLTNGAQITTGSCNPAPMGLIPSSDRMPSSKFIFPVNFATIAAETGFDLRMALDNMNGGTITNVNNTYLAAPQLLDTRGLIIGHVKFVIESLTSMNQTGPTDPQKFVLFRSGFGLAGKGVLSTSIQTGVPAGFYRVCSIISAANHQPAFVPIHLRGTINDCSYASICSPFSPT